MYVYIYVYIYTYIYTYIYIYTYSKDSRQPVVTAVAVRAFSALLLDPGSRPKCCTECTDAQLTCWERVLSFNTAPQIVPVGHHSVESPLTC